MSRSQHSILNVPDVCGYNDYLRIVVDIQRSLGFSVIQDGLCVDAPDAGPPRLSHPLLTQPSKLATAIIHLHWPEKLSRHIGATRLLRWLAAARGAGAVVVRSLHNLQPHETSVMDQRFELELGALTDAYHVFSRRQRCEIMARRGLSTDGTPVVVAPHPGLPPKKWTVTLCGRVA